MDGKWLLRTATVVSAVVALASPSPAAAAPCQPDQTVAVLDQYCESLLTPAGVAPPTAAGPAGPLAPTARPLSAVLSRTEVERLRKAGPAANALLLLPAIAPLAGAPVTPAERRRARVGARKVMASGKLDATEGDARSFATGLASSAGDVVGGAFRWGLVICSVGLAGMSWFRFRARLRL